MFFSFALEFGRRECRPDVFSYERTLSEIGLNNRLLLFIDVRFWETQTFITSSQFLLMWSCWKTAWAARSMKKRYISCRKPENSIELYVLRTYFLKWLWVNVDKHLFLLVGARRWAFGLSSRGAFLGANFRPLPPEDRSWMLTDCF